MPIGQIFMTNNTRTHLAPGVETPTGAVRMMLMWILVAVTASAPLQGADGGCPTAIQTETGSAPTTTSLDRPALADHSLLMASTHPAEDSIEEAKRREIAGLAETDGDRRVRKFLELVVLPMTVCVILIFLLRRGFLD